jgi:hypothetical protein
VGSGDFLIRLADFGRLSATPDAWKFEIHLQGSSRRVTFSTWPLTRSVKFAMLAIVGRFEASEVVAACNSFDME